MIRGFITTNLLNYLRDYCYMILAEKILSLIVETSFLGATIGSALFIGFHTLYDIIVSYILKQQKIEGDTIISSIERLKQNKLDNKATYELSIAQTRFQELKNHAKLISVGYLINIVVFMFVGVISFYDLASTDRVQLLDKLLLVIPKVYIVNWIFLISISAFFGLYLHRGQQNRERRVDNILDKIERYTTKDGKE